MFTVNILTLSELLCVGGAGGVGRGFLGSLSASLLIFMKSQVRGQDKQAGATIGIMVFSHLSNQKVTSFSVFTMHAADFLLKWKITLFFYPAV